MTQPSGGGRSSGQPPPPDPRDAELIEWDDGNEDKFTRHNVTVAEVEQVWENGPVVLPNRRGTGDYKLIGRTRGGRPLTIIVSYDSRRRALRPITAWQSVPADVTRYLA